LAAANSNRQKFNQQKGFLSMRIVIDFQSCQSGSRLGGIGRYSIELAKAMARANSKHELWLVLSNLLPTAEAEVRYEFANLIPQDKIRVFDAPSGIAGLTGNKTKVRAAELIREDFLSRLKPDIVHITSLIEGLSEDVITSVGQVFPGSRTAVTLYDLIPFVQRDRYLTTSDILHHYLGKIENLKKAGLLLSISEFSRREAIDVLGIHPDKIINISSAAEKRFRLMNVSPEVAAELRQRYGVRKNFLMYTGSFDQRKNHVNLIKAFGLLPSSVRKDHQLLIVGNGWDGIYQQLREVGRKSGLGEGELLFAGHVSDADLLPLYNLCDLFVFPSLAEGFGLPVLEAMSCGTPAICSNCTSLPEVIGWKEAQFDPHKPESIAKTMHRALSDNDFKAALRARGLEQSKKFSWDASARKAIEGFERLEDRLRKRIAVSMDNAGVKTAGLSVATISAPNLVEELAKLEGITTLPDGALQEMASCIGLNIHQAETMAAIAAGECSNLRVGWVTTWNTRCGIASYSQFLIDHFSANVTVFAPEAEWTTQADATNIKRCWESGISDDLTRLFAEIKRKSIEVLIVQFNYSFFDFAKFSTFIQDVTACAIRVFVTFHSTHDPSESKRLINIVPALTQCRGLMVHSLKDVKVLRALGLSNNTIFVPQGVVRIKPSSISNLDFMGKTVIATYGFALPGKGMKEMLEAFAILDRSEKGFHLLMVNAEYPAKQSAEIISDVQTRAAELGIADKVTVISDYLKDESSLGYLQHADLIVYAYQNTGESSSAAVRMGIAAGRPVTVTPLSIFDDVAGSVYKLPGISPDDIALGIKETLSLLKNNDPLAQNIAHSALLWRSAHDYASIARHLYWLAAKPKLQKTDYYIPPTFDLTQSSQPLDLMASGTALKTIVGEKYENKIRSTGREGNLMHGPFIAVGQGSYKAIIKGEMGSGGSGNAKADIAINSGTRILSEIDIASITADGTLAELFFRVPEGGCSDLEVRVQVSEKSDILISVVKLAPIEIRNDQSKVAILA
jgi:glycosyltransferase involved in cell wall biosynthesis